MSKATRNILGIIAAIVSFTTIHTWLYVVAGFSGFVGGLISGFIAGAVGGVAWVAIRGDYDKKDCEQTDGGTSEDSNN